MVVLPRARAKPRPRAVFLFLRERNRGGGKVENLLLVFHFSIRLRGRSCGNVEISPALGEISKGLVERVGSRPLAFHSFHSPAFPQLCRLLVFAAAARLLGVIVGRGLSSSCCSSTGNSPRSSPGCGRGVLSGPATRRSAARNPALPSTRQTAGCWSPASKFVRTAG